MGSHGDEHLRRFLAARDAGDGPGMLRWWEELVIDFFPRMDGLVASTHKGRLGEFEHEDAVARSLTRFSEKLVGTFHGTSMGELVNATRTLCGFACMDVQRDAARHRTRSLDEGWSEAGEASPQWEADAAREAQELASFEADVTEFLVWGLPQLIASRRAVVERTFAGATVEEICAELSLSRDNAYQLRSRGLKDLEKLYERYAS